MTFGSRLRHHTRTVPAWFAYAMSFIIASLLCAGSAAVASLMSVVAGEPQIVEFGPTFRSSLGDIAIAADGAIWAAEADGAARLTRDGRVTQIRRPDDCSATPVYARTYEACAVGRPAIGVGPAGEVWMNGSDRLLRFTTSGVRQFDVSTSPKAPTAIVAFAATERGIFTSRAGESGLRVSGRSGEEHRFMRDAGFVSHIVPRPDGAMWLLVRAGESPKLDDPLSLVLRAPASTRRNIAAEYVATHVFFGHFAVAGDGGLIADVAPKRADTRDWLSSATALVHVSPAGVVRELIAIPHQGEQLLPSVGAISLARDGTIWFTESNANRIVALGADGTTREYRDGIPNGTTPVGIRIDDDGTVWYSDPARQTIGRITPTTGAVRVFGNGLSPLSEPGPPVVTHDGAVWFSETFDFHPRIARMATDGTVTEFANFDDQYLPWLQPVGASVAFSSIPEMYLHVDPQPVDKGPDVMILAPNVTKRRVRTTALGCNVEKPVYFCLLQRREHRWLVSPSILGDNFVLGPDGNVWFVDVFRNAIGRVTPAGRVTYFSRGLTRWNSGPQHLALGPDGAVWFTEIRSRVGRISMDGRIKEFSIGIPRRSFLGGIVTGPDKNLWFTLYHGNELGRITPLGVVTRFRRGIYPSRGNDTTTVDSVPFVDRAGRIWFNEPQGGRIARATIVY